MRTSSNQRCVCGASHHVPIDTVVIGEDAFERLGEYAGVREWTTPMVVMDVNTEDVAGRRVADELSRAGLRVTACRYSERSGLLATESAVSRLHAKVDEFHPDSLFAVGSGVVTDLTRYVASQVGLEFVSVPTAASMDGYASSVAAMEFSGLKATFPAVPPVAIFADPVTVAAAPREMTRAGLGDLLGKASSRLDWHIASGLYGEPFCPEVERRVTDSLVQVATGVDDILRQSPRAIAQLLGGLVESGLAMAMMGSSRPASGCEHHASHLWDLLASTGERPHAPHGLQVGYATHFAMGLQRFAFGGGIADLSQPIPLPGESGHMPKSLTGHTAEVSAVMEEKRRYLHDHDSQWPATAAQWGAIQERAVEAMRVFPMVSAALSTAGIPSGPGFLNLDAQTLRTTFRWANRLRPRYTTLDFLEGQGELARAIDAVFP
ncbi:MAG TPA: iron-containing alcohol dehydrogenase [Acidimicrobiales bacterium]|nr:iron-containing alcohol dehydrogenase [Acidimicrobiales bacterium]